MVRLTELSHGGGCGCKISPAKLQDILRDLPVPGIDPNLLVGTETSDDAAVYKLNDEQALVLTTDFFMPIVDNPYDFGRIAATNAISDVYAMGGKPIVALAVVGMPIDKLPADVIREILRGGADVCKSAGIFVAGGHSIDSPEPIYGLVAAGLVNPKRVLKNSGAKKGDAIVAFKPLGVGVMTTAIKKQLLSEADYQAVLKVMTTLNRVGEELVTINGVHALTDVTGFGLLGHLLEMCRGSSLGAEINFPLVPILERARTLAREGVFPGGAKRNWESYKSEVVIEADLHESDVLLLCDPQTSGGLLASVSENNVAAVLNAAKRAGFVEACVVGRFVDSHKGVKVV